MYQGQTSQAGKSDIINKIVRADPSKPALFRMTDFDKS